MNLKVVKQIVVGIAALVVMVLFTACAGVATTPGGTTTFSGSVVSVNAQNHSVTLNVNGQNQTISGLTDQEVALLQNQVGKMYAIQVTQNSDGSYNIETGTNVTPEANETPNGNETPSSNETSSVNEPGSIEFIGNVKSSSNGNLVVSLPNGSSLSMSTNAQTDLGDFNGSLPGVNTRVKVQATANTDGSFTATKIGHADSSDDASIVTFQGVTTSAVNSDRTIHFTVGNKGFSYAIASTADLGDFNNNSQSIGNGVTVKVTVEFNGTTGTVTKISNANQ
jgi:hypothetical protein